MPIPHPAPAKDNPFKSRNAVNLATFVIGAELADVKNIGIQFKDANGNECAERVSVFAYLSTDPEGDDIVGTALDTVAIGTDGLLIPLVTGKAFQLISEADGDVDINITENATGTWYLILVMPDGSLVASGAITFV